MSQSRRTIRFLLGEEERALTNVDPHLTVLNYLRLHENLTGSKEGCAEGDCGACTVVIARPEGEGLRYEALNSCIQFVPQLDGAQVLTVEHLRGPGGKLHPVQEALAKAHGSQCGFCTPGFVMALYALYKNGGETDRGRINDALAGNLCRCTGYGPIVAAAEAMGGDAALNQGEQAVLSRLRDFDGSMLALEGDKGCFFAPTNTQEFAELYEANPEVVLLAGGTDVGLWVTKQHRRFETVISLAKVKELQSLEEDDQSITIGAGVTYARAQEMLTRAFPDFGEVIRRIGAGQVRNAGTLGGNIANGSPIGDTPPILIALGARLTLRKGDKRREMPLEDFFIDYGKQDRAPGEFVESLRVPKLGQSASLTAYKISKRFDQDISAVLGAFHLTVEEGVVTAARIAFGGMAATPKRATHAEACLQGQPWTEATVDLAMDALAQDFTPLTDMRATAGYRLKVAQNLLKKAFLESSDPQALSRVQEVADV
ncbi:MAG: xanthine dehydrogenase small subunit [Alphaproteobacteria bacterium]|nr:MAG: xanthine dehydrogenase small subunit [Alphaproteobacteria bacterium]